MSDNVLSEIKAERAGQDTKFGVQHRKNFNEPNYEPARRSLSDYIRKRCDTEEKLPHEGFTGGASWEMVLEEEFYEALAELKDLKALRKELIQVAAVCVAWIEDLDRTGV